MKLTTTTKTLFAVALALFAVDQASAALMGVYSVPVQDEKLKPYATFPSHAIEVKKSGDQVAIEYYLPGELVGTYTEINFEGTVKSDGSAELTNPEGTMTCASLKAPFTCKMKYSNLKIDPQAVEKYLKTVSKSPEEFKARMIVAGGFGSDPVGILDVNEVASSEPKTKYRK